MNSKTAVTYAAKVVWMELLPPFSIMRRTALPPASWAVLEGSNAPCVTRCGATDHLGTDVAAWVRRREDKQHHPISSYPHSNQICLSVLVTSQNLTNPPSRQPLCSEYVSGL